MDDLLLAETMARRHPPGCRHSQCGRHGRLWVVTHNQRSKLIKPKARFAPQVGEQGSRGGLPPAWVCRPRRFPQPCPLLVVAAVCDMSQDTKRYQEIPGDTGRYGRCREMQGYVGRYGEI